MPLNNNINNNNNNNQNNNIKQCKIDKNLLIGKGPNSKIFKDYKNSLVGLNQEQWEASIGLVLGDASLQSQSRKSFEEGKTYRIKFEWSDKHKFYVDFVYALFNEWVISLPHKKERVNGFGNIVVNWGFQTLSHSAFNPLAKLFIINGKKGISESLIKNHLTARGLAFWWMDDGGKLDYNKTSKNQSVVLNTQSFTEEEVLQMVKELSIKFNLNCEIRSNKGKKFIVISAESFSTFKQIIEPYIHPKMSYKLPK